MQCSQAPFSQLRQTRPRFSTCGGTCPHFPCLVKQQAPLSHSPPCDTNRESDGRTCVSKTRDVLVLDSSRAPARTPRMLLGASPATCSGGRRPAPTHPTRARPVRETCQSIRDRPSGQRGIARAQARQEPGPARPAPPARTALLFRQFQPASRPAGPRAGQPQPVDLSRACSWWRTSIWRRPARGLQSQRTDQNLKFNTFC